MLFGLLGKVTKELENRNILYMLSGSFALNAYSIPRMSFDLDIVLELPEEKLEDFLNIFKEHFYIHRESVIQEVKRKGMFNVIDHSSGFKVDFIMKKETEFRKMEFSRMKRKNIEGIDLWIVSPEDLILSKIIWIQELFSDKQITDIESLLSFPDIDKTYLKEWCLKLNLKTFNLI